MVRLWRKTPNNSKCFGYSRKLTIWNALGLWIQLRQYPCPIIPIINQLRNEMVQQLKDILTALHEPEDTSESAEAPATGDGGEADAAEEAAAETSEGHLDGEANEDSGENENEGEMGDEPLAPGSTIDQMETLPCNGEVSEEWPPCPWIPKTSLRRWKKPKARFEQFLFLRV
jgi:hypothetical protein